MQQLQDSAHPTDHDYRSGSPHIQHSRLYDRLVTHLRAALAEARRAGGSTHLLDVGAGDGAFVEPVLASGWSVTATEMSQNAIIKLVERYGANPQFQVIFDEKGDLSSLDNSRFNILLYTSVLHHIPDYLSSIDLAITQHLEQGGSFVCFQDPLWYNGLPRATYVLSKLSYFWWRISQGNYRKGIQTRIRRVRGVLDQENPADMAEYHVVRNGVNQEEILKMLSENFDHVSLMSYWSTQSGLWQTVGERLNLKNTFAIVAAGYRG